MYSWNDFFASLLYLIENQDVWTLSLGLSEFRGQFQTNWNLTMVASMLFMLPVTFLFLLAQRVFIEGVTGIKGLGRATADRRSGPQCVWICVMPVDLEVRESSAMHITSWRVGLAQ
jgi:hypothetical protein